MKIKSVSVLVPMYNEEGNAKNTITKLKKYLDSLGIKWEILAVNDGSNDKTGKILESLKSKRIRVFHHKVNRGQAAAMKTGFMNAKGEVIVTIDSDLSFPLENIEKIIRKAEKTGADVVMGITEVFENVPKHRVMISNAGNFVYRRIFPIKLKQYTCNFRLYRNDVAKKLEFDPESRFVGKVAIVADIARKKLKISHIPVTLISRKKGKSKFKFKDIFRHLRFAFVIAKMRVCGEFK